MTTVTARWVVVDIEGTLTATKQVHETLYDYARPRLQPWIDEHPDDPEVRAAVQQVTAEAGLPADAPTADVAAVLHSWMDADRKATPLKTLQGLIWQDGYQRGELVTECFPDVAPRLRSWRAQGLHLAVFSSGSAAAQIAAFTHTTDGDLRELFDHHFDTSNAGPKRETDSYRAITVALGASPSEIAFLSDVPAELDAASSLGWSTVGLARPGEPFATADFGAHPVVTGFDEITIEPVPLRQAGQALADESARYAAMGWMRGTSGNLSQVLQRAPLRLAVTASGRDKGELTASDVVVVDATGTAVPDQPRPGQRPSAEAGLHARIAEVSGAGAVVHLHVLAAVLAAQRWPDGVRLRDAEMLKGIGRAAHDDELTIPVVPNSQDMAVLAAAFQSCFDPATPALLVARHGMYVWGEDLYQARHRSECLEWLLRLALAEEGLNQEVTR